MSESNFACIDPDTNPYITQALAASQIYIKNVTVFAVQVDEARLARGKYAKFGVHPDGRGGYVIDTYVMIEENGHRIPKREGDSQPIHPGDWIITNPPQQPGDYPNCYGKTDASFRDRYDTTEQSVIGIYRAKGLIRLSKNPTGGPIRINAYWGDVQYGDAKCYIAAPVDRQNLDDLGLGKRYLLSANDFQTTYRPVEEVLGPDWRDKI